MATSLETLLTTRTFVLADGATGTNYMAQGLASGEAPEVWNLENQDGVRDLHARFIEAGSEIVLTNSFGGNRSRLALHDLESRAAEVNVAAAKLAREAVDTSGREVAVAGSMGPTGELFAPFGPLDAERCQLIFREQAEALAEGGVDLLWVETLSSREELEAALNGASVTGLPVVCTLSFDTHGRTMMGVSPADFAGVCRALSPAPNAFGANCGLGPAETVAGVLNLAQAVGTDDVLVAKGNCGIPEYRDGAVCYGGSPELMARYARLTVDAGARIVGGCCGTTPEHVVAMREALTDYTPGARPDMERVVAELGEVTKGAIGQQGAAGSGA